LMIMNTLLAWLDQRGLGKYAELFAENDIDLDVLPDLTDADLDQLGVSLGDRRRILKEAARLQAVASAQEPHAAPPPGTGEAERRQLTVMFCDLVGSTALSTTLDPEDFRDVVKAYQDACVEEVARFGGHIAKYLGDGLLIYFGYPKAHEDDAERAVHAGLGVVEAVKSREPRPGLSLATRIGIATGQVVAGDLVGEHMSEERAVLGDVPNLAARLQEVAEPDTVLISEATRRLTGGVFQYEDRGAQQLKGIATPVQLWRAVSERAVESRFEAREGQLTAFVGREPEIGLLLDRWARAVSGEGQVALLSGEAGIGKSRFAQALQERCADVTHTRVHYQCSSHHTNSALYPAIRQLERAAGWARDDASERKLDKLKAFLDRSGMDAQLVMPLFTALLSIPTDNQCPGHDTTPQQRKEKTLAAIADYFVGLSATGPVLFILEDAQWIDPTTEELIALVIERIRE
jgi:class 3 adenylate cyclase